MKRFIPIALFSLLALSSCDKYDDIDNTNERVGISRVVFYPTIAITGDRFIILRQGEAFTDPGAVASLNGEPAQYTVGAVNTAVPGVYELEYRAANPEGYAATDWRTVVVIGNDVIGKDLSGSYLRPGFAVSTWTKTAEGVYSVDNPGGAASGIGYKVVAVNYTGNKIKIPRQFATDPAVGSPAIVSSTSESYDPTSSPVKYFWAFLAGGYGSQVREFRKQ